MPECFGVPVVTCLRAFFTCTQGCGCDEHPAFPAPSFLERDIAWQDSGDVPREREAMSRVASRVKSRLTKRRKIDAKRASIDARSGLMGRCCQCGDLSYSRSNNRLDHAGQLGYVFHPTG